jgi:hypothetical protein
MRNPNRLIKATASTVAFATIGGAALTGCSPNKPQSFNSFAKTIEAQRLPWRSGRLIDGELAVETVVGGLIVETEVFTQSADLKKDGSITPDFTKPSQIDVSIYPPGTTILPTHPQTMSNLPDQTYALALIGETSTQKPDVAGSVLYLGGQAVELAGTSAAIYNSKGGITFRSTSAHEAHVIVQAVEDQMLGIAHAAADNGTIGPFTGVITP